VSAWAKRNGVSLGQVKTDEKSNEITAIPALLGLLELRGCIVTLDAMGCQREIAEKIREQGADYVLAVKANQKELHQAIEDYFETAQQAGYRAVPLERWEEVDSDHGRVEVRRYELVPDLSTLPKPEQWKDLQRIARVECERHMGKQVSSEVRYYITSFGQKVERLAEAVRGHWGIENSAHLGVGRDLPGRRQPASYWLWSGELRGYPPPRLKPPQTRTFQRKSQAETLQGCVKQ
jgi:predicted transposase YbfD/YdcC